VIYKSLLIILFAVKKFFEFNDFAFVVCPFSAMPEKTIIAKSSIRKLIPYILF